MERKTFLEYETAQKRKLYLLFFIIFLFYSVGVLVLLGSLTVLLFIFAPELFLISAGWGFKLGVAFAISLVAALGHWYYSLHTGRDHIVELLNLKVPDYEDRYHQMYKNTVEEMGIALGKPNINALVIPTKAMNALSFALPGDQGFIAVTEGAISRLSRAQLQALVAQAVARCAIGEALLNTAACCVAGIYESFQDKMQQYESEVILNHRSMGSPQRGGRGDGLLFFLVFLRFPLFFLHFCFTSFQLFLSRESGIHADAIAVKLNRDALALAQAYYICNRSWRGSGIRSQGVAPLFTLPGGSARIEESMGESVFNTHPSTKKRIDLLVNQANVDATVLHSAYERAITSAPITTSAVQASQERKEGWYIKEGKDWKGPFGLDGLKEMTSLRPDTWLKLGTNMYPAYAIPSLMEKMEQEAEYRKGNCPNCSTYLSTAERTGVRVRKCSQCRGILLRNDQQARVLLRRENDYPKGIPEEASQLPSWEEWQKEQEGIERPERLCPECGRKMESIPYNLAYPVEINRCEPCKLTWYDARELDIVQYLIERSRTEN